MCWLFQCESKGENVQIGGFASTQFFQTLSRIYVYTTTTISGLLFLSLSALVYIRTRFTSVSSATDVCQTMMRQQLTKIVVSPLERFIFPPFRKSQQLARVKTEPPNPTFHFQNANNSAITSLWLDCDCDLDCVADISYEIFIRAQWMTAILVRPFGLIVWLQ